MGATLLLDLTAALLGVVVVVTVVAWVRGRRSPSGDAARRRWIDAELSRQEAAHPGGAFSDDEYMARLEALEERWDDEHLS
jgi:hypothetical protein